MAFRCKHTWYLINKIPSPHHLLHSTVASDQISFHSKQMWSLRNFQFTNLREINKSNFYFPK